VVTITQKQNYQKHYYPEENNGICVVRRKGETVEELIKRFRKKWSKSGIAKELKERMYYEKPSDKRRRKRMQSIRAIKRDEEKQRLLQEKIEKAKAKRKRKGAKKKYDQSNQRQSGSGNVKKGENQERANHS
jgi:small subunit ribosomal protein S21